MSNIIYGNMVGGAAPLKTLIMQDESGNEMVGVVTESAIVFTADPKTDIREGTVAATDAGVVTGEAVIPNYETSTGVKIVKAGSAFTISLITHDTYDYTEIQCIICPFDTSMDQSIAAEKVVIGDDVYSANSTDSLATITKNTENKSVDLNIINTSDVPYIIRYFTYKELYQT